ncbi:MAG TPA: hypothetical protein VH650_08575, partial [Gaiellaceae bacterium]
PGAPGVGPGRAAAVLVKHGTLEAALEAGGFPDRAEALREYRRIATLQTDAPIPELPDAEPDWASAAAVLERWGHAGLGQRLRDRA